VPDPWVLAVASRLRAQRGVPTYGDVFRLIELSHEQITGLNSYTGSNVAPANLTSVWGSREALSILQASGRAKTALIPVIPADDAPDAAREAFWKSQDQGAVRISALDLRHRDFVLSFLAAVEARGRLMELGELEKLQINVYGQPDWKQTYAGFGLQWDYPEYQATQVQVRVWGSDKDHFHLYLPHSLPDDRRAKTKVNVTDH
jgi:hypothetical protein